jgi:hypothetical protein
MLQILLSTINDQFPQCKTFYLKLYNVFSILGRDCLQSILRLAKLGLNIKPVEKDPFDYEPPLTHCR